MPTHRINKVLLDFSFPLKEKDIALQKTKDLFYEKLLPEMSARFDGFTGNLHIDKLEIDLGKTTAENFESDFLKAFTESFHQYIDPVKAATITHPGPVTGFPANDPQQANITTRDALLYFLERGYWPWNFQQRPVKELIKMVASLLKDTVAVQQLFIQASQVGTYATTRLLHFIATDTGLKKTFISTLENIHPALAYIIPLLPVPWQKKIFGEGNFYFLLATQLLSSPALNNRVQITELVENLVRVYYSAAAVNASPILKARNPKILEAPEHGLKALFLFIEQQPALKEVDQVIHPEALPGESNEAITGYATLKKELTEKIPILNAGLVLFHPFLRAVFHDLGWIGADKKFINGNAQRKAVLFLQYLVNGKSRQPEHGLVLNKILCGWPVHLSLPAHANFSAKEKNAVTDLIESLKENWPVVKNTSNRGLVESFVNRPGLLQQTEKGFLLQVERKSIDILLDSLPLNLNLIKLPWNEQIIYTEW